MVLPLTLIVEARISVEYMRALRVLLVDDYKPFIRILRSMLPNDRFEVIGQASDGLEAIKEAESLRPDLVLLDVGLPKMNGIEVAKALRKLLPRAIILMLSQDPSAEVVAEALNVGAAGYVHKQRAQRELLPAIDMVLEGKQFVSPGLLAGELSDDAPTEFLTGQPSALQRQG